MTRGSSRPHIVGVGVACLDYLFLAPRAEHGQGVGLRDYVVQGGGLVGTALVAAARLGASTEIWTWVGDDREGEQVVAGLREEGVDTARVGVIAGARSPVSFVHVEVGSGERTIYHGPRLDIPEAEIVGIAERSLSCDVMVVDAVWAEASQAGAALARAQGMPVVGDFCPHEGLRDLAARVTALIVPQGCADRLAPSAPREEQLGALARLGPGFVAITAGAEGCFYMDGGEVAHQPAFRVPVVDTTGAGDVFHGAFAYALGRGWPGGQSAEFASAAAVLSCRALGGRTAAPSLEETLGLLREQGSEVWRAASDSAR